MEGNRKQPAPACRGRVQTAHGSDDPPSGSRAAQPRPLKSMRGTMMQQMPVVTEGSLLGAATAARTRARLSAPSLQVSGDTSGPVPSQPAFRIPSVSAPSPAQLSADSALCVLIWRCVLIHCGPSPTNAAVGHSATHLQQPAAIKWWPECQTACVAGDGLSAGLGSDQAVDAFQGELGAAVRSLEDAVADERVFLRPSADVSAAARAAAKALFDHIDSLSAAAAAAGELYVEGFDAEQIWGQLELQVGPATRVAAPFVTGSVTTTPQDLYIFAAHLPT